MSEEDWTIVSKPVVASKWEDEEDEEVKDNWDDEDEEDNSKASSDNVEANKPVEPTLAVAGKKKKGKALKEKIAQKELEQSRPRTHEELVAQKLEEMRLQQESDLEVAKDILGAGAGSDASVLSSIRLNTKKDFEDFAKALNDKLSAYNRSPHYILFLETLFRDLAAGIEPDNIKKLDNVLTSLFNEKIKTQKQTTKKKKKNQDIKVERDDDYTYNERGYDDFDDFI